MKALQWLTTQRQQAVKSVKKLAGLTACSQLVTLTNGERYVLRQQQPQATNYGISYSQEADILRTLSPLSLSPQVLYQDRENVILNWLEGQVPPHFDDKCLAQLATRLATLHQFRLPDSPDFSPLPSLNLAQRCQFLWETLPLNAQQNMPFRPPFYDIAPFATAICHHDIHLNNLVVQGNTLFLIDWEYAAVSDPALELALFLQTNPLSSQQQAVFFEHYFAKNPQNITACYAKMAEYQPEVEKLNQLWYAHHQINENNSYL